MQNLMKKSYIYLSGGGNEKQSFSLDKFFFDTFPKNGSFLYVPVALRGDRLYLKTQFWMKNILKIHNRSDIQFETADDLSKYKFEDLKNFDALYISGGNTWNLMQELRKSGFSQEFITYIKNGGVVYGGSAGAIVLGKNIDTHDDENKINLKGSSGLNLLNEYSVACHYTNKQAGRFHHWTISHNSPIICLPEETGVVLVNNSVLCVGTQSCIIYFVDGAKKEIQPGSSFTI